MQSLRDKSPWTRKDIELAYDRLCKTGWAWKPKLCGCGGQLFSVSLQYSRTRGVGRKFYRSFDVSLMQFPMFSIFIVSLLLLFILAMQMDYVLLSLSSLLKALETSRLWQLQEMV